jgi:ribosome biogenesis GTPase
VCKARGRFRNDGIVPLPGDMVIFTLQNDSPGFIEEIETRRNELKRPRVANVDMVAIVVSAQKPAVDKLLCDKMIVYAKRAGIMPLLVVNKCDVAQLEKVAELRQEYKDACQSVCVSAETSEGLTSLKSYLDNRCTCFAGQSATGKSSLLNALFDKLSLETGGLSKKVDRGRHTTRHAELLILEGFTGTVVDTPGFSFLEADQMHPAQLRDCYDDFESFSSMCRFRACLHESEPQCGVKDAVSRGLINKSRYQRYLMILKELQEMREKEYD